MKDNISAVDERSAEPPSRLVSLGASTRREALCRRAVHETRCRSFAGQSGAIDRKGAVARASALPVLPVS
jgi:hypothetical protein